VVLRLETAGGLLSPAYALSRFPELTLYGDGRVITDGPQVEIYPGPALPNVRVVKISEEAVQAILRAARAAGLLGPDRHILNPRIADAPTTTFTVVAAGRRHVISANALGMDAGLHGARVSEEDRIRAALFAFQGKLSTLESWLPNGSFGEDQPYVPAGLRVFVRAGAPAAQPGLKEPVIDWPLATPLAGFGRPLQAWPDLRCVAVTDRNLAKVLSAARRANQLTPWRSGKATYSITFRPLLPDESGCPR
jgi:hypothetical protein